MPTFTRAAPLIAMTTLALALGPGCGDDGSASTGASETEATSGASATEGTSGAGTETDGATETTGDSDGATGGGQSWPSPDDAPSYDGDNYVGMQIYDVEAGVWLDELALMEGLDPVRLVFVGEQHETPAIHELQRWTLERLLLRHDNVTLAMEHFQADEQEVLDAYLAGDIDSATFESTSDPWDGYAKYWKQLVDTMKIVERPVIALNVPSEALDGIYASFPTPPLDVFNGWGGGFEYDAYIPPRPLMSWDATYQGYFEGSYDYDSHGKDWGLSYEEALDYFTALALIRDDTMGYHIARVLEETDDRVLMVGGDWHVQTGLATPDSVTKFTAEDEYRLITTATTAGFDALKAATYADRPYADYILVYDPL
ncbi:MAG: ChaN family lipoprotein [Nannocystaceae bacterium]